MTKELLEQYPDICEEIERLKQPVTDTVSGSLPVYPYTRRTWTIQGICGDRNYLEDLTTQKQEILDFVKSLTPKEKPVIIYRALCGLSWAGVAAKMGHRHTEEAVKKKYQRMMKKYF